MPNPINIALLAPSFKRLLHHGGGDRGAAMMRLFAALRPPAAIRVRLLAAAAPIPGARWQDDEQLHLTLRFIGAVDERTAENVAAALAGLHAAAPVIRLAGVGRFGDKRAGAALWAGVQPHDALAQLHRKVDQACVRAGLTPEGRAYLPHLTLARLGRGAAASPEVERWLADTAGLTSEPFACGHLILYESSLGREGARYAPLLRWPLAAGVA